MLVSIRIIFICFGLLPSSKNCTWLPRQNIDDEVQAASGYCISFVYRDYGHHLSSGLSVSEGWRSGHPHSHCVWSCSLLLMKIYVCWKMRRARCWPLTLRGALFWCFHAKLSFLWRWFFSFTQASESEGDRVLLGILYLREYRSDWVLVNEGGCLPPECSPLWSCLNVVHDGAAVLDAMLLYGVGTTKFGNVSTKVGPPRLAMPQV